MRLGFQEIRKNVVSEQLISGKGQCASRSTQSPVPSRTGNCPHCPADNREHGCQGRTVRENTGKCRKKLSMQTSGHGNFRKFGLYIIYKDLKKD